MFQRKKLFWIMKLMKILEDFIEKIKKTEYLDIMDPWF